MSLLRERTPVPVVQMVPAVPVATPALTPAPSVTPAAGTVPEPASSHSAAVPAGEWERGRERVDGGAEPARGNILSGLVTDMKGTPIAGASVSVLFEEKGSQAKIDFTADSKGRFTSRRLPFEQVKSLTAQAPGFLRSDPMPPFELPLEGLEIALRPAPTAQITVWDARRGGEGPVPFEGAATIYLLRQNQVERTTATLGIEESSLSAGQYVAVHNANVQVKQGRYSPGALDAGIYKVGISVEGEQYTEGEPFRIDVHEGGQGSVTLGNRQVLDGVVKSDPEQEPIAGAEVVLEASGKPLVAGPAERYRTLSGPDGAFRFTGVVPGDYRLVLAAPEFTTKTLDRISVPQGPPPAPATFYLVREQPPVTVSVFGPEGRPLSHAPLVLLSSGAGAQARSWFGRTDGSGVYSFPVVPPGRYTLAVTSPDNRSRQKMVDLVVEEKTVPALEVRFAPTVRVEGKASRKEKPLQETLVSFLPRGAVGPETFAKTDVEGNYQVDLEPGEYMAGEARQEKRTLLKVEPGQLQTANLEIP